MSKRDAFVQNMVNIANDDSHGYSQASRWPSEGSDFDCSSLVYWAANQAGYDVTIGPAGVHYTGTIIEDFTRAGFRCDDFDGNLSDLEPGDILLSSSHVAVYVGNGQLCEASSSETGGIYGEPGDQTGWEIHVGVVYGGWQWVLTPPSEGGSGGDVPHTGTLYGIDVSSHDEAPFKWHTENAYGGSDFVIVKKTQGNGAYVNDCFDYAYNRAKSDGKLLGIYHYASNSNARAEAEFFYSHTRNFIGEFIPVLDWESYQNEGNWGNTGWCREFVDRYHELSGVYPAIYVQASAIWQCENCADRSPLWVAGYPGWAGDNWNVSPDDMPYGIGAWNNWTIWQYTSDGGTDRNVANIDADAWRALAGGQQEDDMPTPADLWNYEIDGVPAWARLVGIDIAANGANNKIDDHTAALKVWEFDINGVQARDRLYGIDMAANKAAILDEQYLPAIMRAIEKVADKNGIDVSKIAAEVQAAVKEELEKISLDVTVKN